MPLSSSCSETRVRAFQIGDEADLHAIFHSAVHQGTVADYSAVQRAAWAPEDWEMRDWQQLMRRLQPCVLELAGRPVAYADLQPNGDIGHFFVHADHTGQGMGRRLMQHLLDEAAARGIKQLQADVSLTAQPFFRNFGFEVLAHREVTRRGVRLFNARMQKTWTELVA